MEAHKPQALNPVRVVFMTDWRGVFPVTVGLLSGPGKKA